MPCRPILPNIAVPLTLNSCAHGNPGSALRPTSAQYGAPAKMALGGAQCACSCVGLNSAACNFALNWMPTLHGMAGS
jgi:hypothetical protein